MKGCDNTAMHNLHQLTPSEKPTPTWQTQLQHAVRDPETLFAHLSLPPDQLPAAKRASRLFPLLVPHAFLNRMVPGQLDDPLLRQVLPLDAESALAPGFSKDPLAEAEATPLPGVLHKYKSRLLLITTGACAVHCRYCFRRHFPYGDNQLSESAWPNILAYLEQHPDINEVIFSGGDPLLLSDEKLARALTRLAALPQLTRFRLHSRLPIVLPARITPELCNTLSSTRLQAIVVIHSNHANEIDNAVMTGLAALSAAKVTLLNQSVLLRGVNDDVTCLATLSETLFASGVLPYYLHQLDPVQGTAHFAVEATTAACLYRELQAKLPGFLVPKWVTEQAGAAHKLLLSS